MSELPSMEAVDEVMAMVRACIYKPALIDAPYDWEYHIWVARDGDDEDVS